MIEHVADSLALTPGLLTAVLIGVVLGLLAGLLPGVSTLSALLVVAPITVPLAAGPAVALLVGAYAGARAATSVTAILHGVPGDTTAIPASAAGYAMTRAGHGTAALWAAGLGGVLATAAAALVIPLVTPSIQAMVRTFGPPELAMLMVAALAAAAGLLGRSLTRGTASLSLGLVAGMMAELPRGGPGFLTLGLLPVDGPIEVGAVVIGLLVVGEVLHRAVRPSPVPVRPSYARTLPAPADLRRSWLPWLRGIAIGLPFGLVPPGAADVAARLGATAERRLGRRRPGTARIEEVAGAEAAAAVASAGMLALLFMVMPQASVQGLTASASLPALGEHLDRVGMRTGDAVFGPDAGGMVPVLLGILFLATVLAYALVLPAGRLLVRVVRIPPEFAVPAVLAFAVCAVVFPYLPMFWSVNPAMLVVFGVAGLLMRRAAVPLVPAVIAFLLASPADGLLDQALAQGRLRGSGLGIFVSSPACLILLGVTLTVLLAPVITRVVRASRDRPAELS